MTSESNRHIEVNPQEHLNEIRRLLAKAKRSSSKSMEEMRALEREFQINVEKIKYELGKEIIEQANAPINRAVSVLSYVLAAVVIVGGAFAWITTNNLKSTLQTLMTQRIEGWLSLNNDSSEASKTLDTYRTRALLDSYMIQLARRKAQSDIMARLDFKAGDEKRLLSIVQSTSSDRQDFYDALRLLALADGEWGIIAGENGLGRQLVGLLKDPQYDATRKLEILQILSRDRNLLEVEADYIQDESAPESFRYQSYLNLKGYDKNSVPNQLALKYATALIRGSKSTYKVQDALEFIASVDPDNADLTAFLGNMSERQREVRMGYRLAVAKGLISQLPSPSFSGYEAFEESEPVDRGLIRSKVAELMSELLDDGLVLGVDENFSGKPHLEIRYTQASGVALSTVFPLDRLLQDELLIQEIYKRQYTKGLDRFARFFSTLDRGEVVTQAKLTVSAEQLGVGRDTSLPKAIIGRLEFAKDGTLKFAWRDSLGDWQTSAIETLIDATVSLTVDKNYISYRDTSLTDWIF
jgi:hypothetical protein